MPPGDVEYGLAAVPLEKVDKDGVDILVVGGYERLELTHILDMKPDHPCGKLEVARQILNGGVELVALIARQFGPFGPHLGFRCLAPVLVDGRLICELRRNKQSVSECERVRLHQ